MLATRAQEFVGSYVPALAPVVGPTSPLRRAASTSRQAASMQDLMQVCDYDNCDML
jgi:hypothetical protein